MFRDEKYLSINSKAYDGFHDKTYKRELKSSEKRKQLRFKVNILKKSICRLNDCLEKNKDKETILKTKNNIKEKEKELHCLELQLKNIPEQYCHKNLKYSVRKIKKEQLKKEILNHINDAKMKNASFITKEDVAIKLRVKVSDVENIFRELNIEGVLSQPKHYALHDSNRDPNGFDGASGWAGDIYYLRKNKKEESL